MVYFAKIGKLGILGKLYFWIASFLAMTRSERGREAQRVLLISFAMTRSVFGVGLMDCFVPRNDAKRKQVSRFASLAEVSLIQ